ncbi:metabotropic glutamate receptor-like [Dermacentor variabilis]|uniref:metabotropic glutamate receptor-like n=1 Tax=Dermacentor variabilis TaxID=34621 RepID=UPI003F5C0B09
MPEFMALKLALLALTVLESQGARIEIPGDIIIGGLFPVHHRSGRSGCGPINGERGVQRLEAMLFALDRINQDPSLLGGISLGATILDTCSSGEHALKQTLQFVDPPVDTGRLKCADGSLPNLDKDKQKITGIIGGSYSEVSQKVASFLSLFHVPQISPASTASSLGDKTRYDLFARTVPPDTLQAHVMADIVHYFNWTYVSLVTSEGAYGDSGMTSFLRDAKTGNFCVAVVEVVPRLTDEATFDAILQSLLRRPQARVVALFTHGEDSRALLAAAKRANVSNHFVWLASDGWGTQAQIVEGLEDQAEGAITIELDSRVIPEYDAYMKNLTVDNNKRNPWFREYWEDVFQCSVEPSQQNNTSVACSDSLRLHESAGYRQGAKIQFVVDAVYALAHALDEASKQLCRGQNESYCEAFRNLDGENLYMNYLLNTTFEDLVGSVVRFDQLGDGLVPYRIYNYRRLDNSSINGYIAIGRWEPYTLHLDSEKVLWHTEDGEPPVSACSSDCAMGQIKVISPDSKCCWLCAACGPLKTVIDEFTCAA